MTGPLPSVFLNGTVGSGKTTTAFQLSALLRGRGIPHAVIDLDALRTGWPAPAEDPFNHELELANLQSVAANFTRAGARMFILAGVLEDSGEMERYRGAVGASPLVFCRLVCSNTELSRRISLRHRDDPEAMAWHLRRAPELTEILNRTVAHGSVVDTTGRTPEEVAGRVLRQLDSVSLAG